MRIIMVWNSKGGVGKTTTVGNLSLGLSNKGYKVLNVDIDYQSNLTSWYIEDFKGYTMYDVLNSDINIQDATISVNNNLDLVPSSKELWKINSKIALNTEFNPFEYAIKDIKKLDYDFVIVDCPANMSLLHVNTMLVCKEIFMPVSMDFLSLEGVTQVYDEMKNIKRMKHIINITTIIPTFVDYRNKRTVDVIDNLKKQFQDRLTNPIRICTKLAESLSFHKSIFEYDNKCHGSEDYEYLIERVLEDNEIYNDLA